MVWDLPYEKPGVAMFLCRQDNQSLSWSLNRRDRLGNPLCPSWDELGRGDRRHPGKPLLDHYPLTAPNPGGSPRIVFQPRAPGAAPSLGVPRNSGCTGHWRPSWQCASIPSLPHACLSLGPGQPPEPCQAWLEPVSYGKTVLQVSPKGLILPPALAFVHRTLVSFLNVL